MAGKKTPPIYHLARALPIDTTNNVIDETLDTLVARLEEAGQIGEKLEMAETIVQTLEGLDAVSQKYQVANCLPSLSRCIISVVDASNDDEESLANLLSAARIATELPELRRDVSEIVFQWLQNALFSFHERGAVVSDTLELPRSSSLESLLKALTTMCDRDGHDSIYSETDVERLMERTVANLKFLQYELLHMKTIVDACFMAENNVPELLTVFAALGQPNISRISAELLGKALEAASANPEGSKLIRDLIFHLVENEHLDVALSLWLRWVDSPSPVGPVGHLTEEQYWKSIQKALISGTPAIRKLLLYIVARSLRLISKSFTTSIFSWDMARKEVLLAAWDRYITLTDTVGIQCSPNQFADALPELRKLLDAGSHTIHGSWFGILFSMAFRSTSGGLQKFAYSFIFGLDQESLFFIEQTEGFLTKEFLFYMLMPQHFQHQLSKPDTCEHGVELVKFLERFIRRTHNRTYVADMLDLVHEEGEHMFSPSRLYLLDGISRGISALESPILNLNDMRRIVRNTEFRRLAKMRKHISLLLYLEILAGVNLDGSTVDEVLEFLSTIAWVLQDRDSRRVFTLDLAIKLLKKVHPDGKPWVKSLKKGLRWKDQVLDGPKQEILKAMLTGAHSGSSLMSYFAYLLFGPKIIRTATTHHVEGSSPKDLSDFRTQLLIRVFGESEAASVPFSLVRGGQKSAEAERDFDELLDTFNYSQFCCLPLNQMEVLSKLEARGNGHRQIVKDMDQQPSAAALLSLIQMQSSDDINRESMLQAAKRTTSILHLRANMLEAGLIKVDEDENTLLSLIESIEVPRSQANDVVNSENLSVYGALLEAVYGNFHIQVRSRWKHLFHSRRFYDSAAQLPEFLSRFMGVVSRQQRYLEGPAILPVLDFIHLFIEKVKIPGDPPYNDYGEERVNYDWLEDTGVLAFLKECWESLEQYRGGLEQSVIIKTLLNIIFAAGMIEASDIPAVKNLTKEVAGDVLKLSSSRLGLLATFTKQLHSVATLSPIAVSRHFYDREDLADIVFQVIGFDFQYSPDPLLERPLAADILQNRLSAGDADDKGIISQYYDYNDTHAFLYIFDIVSQLDHTNHSERTFGLWIRERILKLWTERGRKGDFLHVKKRRTRHLQTLLMLERFVDERDVEFVDTVMACLAAELHPRFRFMFEWILCLAIQRHNGFAMKIQQALEQEDNAKKANPKYQSSLLAVAVKSASLIDIENRVAYYERLLSLITGYTVHNKVVIRHQAITGILQVYNEISTLLSVFGALSQVDTLGHGTERVNVGHLDIRLRSEALQRIRSNPLLESLYNSIKKSAFYKENTRSMEEQIAFNARDECTMSGIFEGAYLEGGDYVEQIPVDLFDNLPPTLEGRVRFVDIGTETDYAHQYSDDDTDENESEADVPTKSNTQQSERFQMIPFTKTELMEADPLAKPSIAGILQTKSRSDPTAPIIPPTPTFPSLETSTDSDEPILILVASHVTSPPNLGGLCRLSEIFGVKILYLADPTVVTSKDFTAVSVSSEVWLPIQGLSPDASTQRDFFDRMRREGFSIVGVEQTDSSHVLGARGEDGKELWRFPKRCVLVLGSEREGMPADVLCEMDVCVEIKQRGETRSLNVQVAAGVVVGEFNRQWGL